MDVLLYWVLFLWQILVLSINEFARKTNETSYPVKSRTSLFSDMRFILHISNIENMLIFL